MRRYLRTSIRESANILDIVEQLTHKNSIIIFLGIHHLTAFDLDEIVSI